MCGQPFDVEHGHIVLGEYALHHGQGKVEEVLVIHGVELAQPDEVQEVGELDRQHAVVSKQLVKTSDEIVHFRRMGENVYGHDQFGRSVAPHDIARFEIERIEADVVADSGAHAGFGGELDQLDRLL